MKPPRLSELLEDPVFRKYMKTIPRLTANLAHGQPWAVYARRKDGRWIGAKFCTYREAWLSTIKLMRDHTMEDVSLVSRRQLFDPPPGVFWDEVYFDWCPRCRRPTSFIIRPRHHAVKVMNPEDDRCYYCGIRHSAYHHVGRVDT